MVADWKYWTKSADLLSDLHRQAVYQQLALLVEHKFNQFNAINADLSWYSARILLTNITSTLLMFCLLNIWNINDNFAAKRLTCEYMFYSRMIFCVKSKLKILMFLYDCTCSQLIQQKIILLDWFTVWCCFVVLSLSIIWKIRVYLRFECLYHLPEELPVDSNSCLWCKFYINF